MGEREFVAAGAFFAPGGVGLGVTLSSAQADASAADGAFPHAAWYCFQ